MPQPEAAQTVIREYGQIPKKTSALNFISNVVGRINAKQMSAASGLSESAVRDYMGILIELKLVKSAKEGYTLVYWRIDL